MRQKFIVDVTRGREGYKLGTFVKESSSSTIMGSAYEEPVVCMIEKKGDVISERYEVGRKISIWKIAARCKSDQQIIDFFRKVGPIANCNFTHDGEHYWHLNQVQEFFESIRFYADKRKVDVDSFGKRASEKFHQYTQGGLIARRADIYLDRTGEQSVTNIKIRNLYEFMLVEMLSDFGVTRRGVESQRSCENCGNTFIAGGGAFGSKRSDARFCSPTCARAASRQRIKHKITLA